MITIRASAANNLAQCPAFESRQPLFDELPARKGSAVHDAMANWHRGACTADDLSSIAAKWRVDLDDLRISFYATVDLWRNIEQWFVGERHVEEELVATAKHLSVEDSDRGLTVTCHPDIYSVVHGEDGKWFANLADYKTGFLDSDCYPQMLCYAEAIMLRHPEVEFVRVFVLRPIEKTVDCYEIGSERGNEEFRKLWRSLEANELRPSSSICSRCAKFSTCDAGRSEFRHQLQLVSGGELSNLDPVRTLQFVRAAESRLKEVSGWIRQVAELSGGRIETEYGVAELLEQRERELDDSKALGVLRADFGNEIDGIVSISTTAMDKLIESKAVPRKKKADREAYMAKLEECGALKYTKKKILKLRPPAQKIACESPKTITSVNREGEVHVVQ